MEILLSRLTRRVPEAIARIAYWIVLCGFYGLMVVFVFHTIGKSFTVMALIVCLLLVVTPRDQRRALIIFLAGSALGYFLELWGTLESVGLITLTRLHPCLLCLLTDWRQWRFGDPGRFWLLSC